MALVLADRVRETTTVTGTGTATLLGAVSGYQSFSAVGNSNTTYYVIANQSASEWEVGIGTYTSSGTTLSRDTVLSSSNSGSLVNFSAGTKDVFVDYPASKAVYEDASGNVAGYPITGGTIDNTVIGGTTPAAGTFTTLTANSTSQFGKGSANYWQAVGGATTVSPVFSVLGTDTNIDLSLTTKGTGAINLNTGNGIAFKATEYFLSGTTANYIFAAGRQASNPPVLGSAGSDTNISLAVTSKGTGSIAFTTSNGSLNQFQISHTASAVNYVQVTGGATGGIPAISAQGSDGTVPLSLSAKGGTGIIFFTNSGTNRGFRVTHATNSVNYITAEGSATGFASRFYTTGTDTNIPIAIQTSGTGAIDLAAGSSGVNISNGGTVTAITGTNIGASYTSFPSVVISAPTTAGGVQATASVAGMISNNPITIVSGGTGYTVGDTLTVVGGTSISGAATLTVNSVSGGVITAIFNLNFAGYTVLPTNPVSVTGGTGSGATFNLTYSLRSASGFTITNAGSGYVEQPTVSFSGGGGSGAAAYATVGSSTTLRSLGNTISFATPAGVQAQISESAGATPTALVNLNGSSFGLAYVTAAGSAANAGLLLVSKGTSPVDIYTNSTGSRAASFSHTASAVNYVQVTGGVTGGGIATSPTIGSQGSDTNVSLNLNGKGSAGVRIASQRTNFITITGSGSGGGLATFTAEGGDTNIDLALTPKGTGNVRFGTYTANMALTVQGYIEIKDSGGTVRKLAVIA